MARRDLSGAVDFAVLERMTGGDDGVTEEILGLFAQQAALWSPLLDVREEGWRDAVHTLRGAAAGIGAEDLTTACAAAETAALCAAKAVLASATAVVSDNTAVRLSPPSQHFAGPAVRSPGDSCFSATAATPLAAAPA